MKQKNLKVIFSKFEMNNIARKKFISFLIILFSITLIINYLTIVKYVNDKYQCQSNDYIEELNHRIKTIRIKFPHVFETLPHLKEKLHSLRPKYVLTNNRKNVSFVIGLSTIKRENITYLYRMLDSLFNGMNIQEKDQSLVVLLIAEVNNLLFVYFF
jgi:hypothetical protein